MMRRVARTGSEIDEERLFRRRRFLLADPADRLLRHGFGEVPVFLVVRRFDGRRVLVEWRFPLARLSALEPIPVVESLSDGPAIERPACTELVVGRVVPFAERR